MNEVLTTPEARPDSLGSDVAHGREQHRVERDAGAEAEQRPCPAARRARNRAVDRRPREQREPGRGQQQADRERPPDAEPHDDLRRQAERERGHDQVGGQERESDLHRRVAEHELHVQRGDEEPREHGRGPQHADDVGGRDIAQAEQAAAASSGARTRASMTRNVTSSSAARAEEPERLRRGPARLVAVHDGVYGEHQRRW